MPAKRNRVPKATRLKVFGDPSAEVVWAGLMALDVALQHQVLRELASRLAVTGATRLSSPETKVRAAVGALRDAFDILGHSPSVRDYTALRASFLELELPPESNIRQWLGGKWNDCLKRALLPAASDGDFAHPTLEEDFSEDEIINLIIVCAEELDTRPSFSAFKQWVRRPDVEARFPRRPLTAAPFTRFGGWPKMLDKADTSARERGIASPISRVIPRTYAFSPEEQLACLREVAARVAAENGGRSPRIREYDEMRLRMHEESIAAGAPRGLPSSATITNEYRSWDTALVEAGLEPLGGRKTRSFPRPRRPTYTPEQKAQALREAWAEIGDPFIQERYADWREGKLAEADLAGTYVEIPSVEVIRAEWNGWQAACLANLPGYRPPKRRRRETRRAAGDGDARSNRDEGTTRDG